MRHEVDHLRDAPRRSFELGREQATDIRAEFDRRDIHQDQCKQERRDGKSEEGEGGEHVVADGIFPHGREDANRQRNGPCGQQTCNCQHKRQRHALPDQARYRLLPLEGYAEITAADDAPYPFQVLDYHGIAEAETFTQLRGGVLVDDFVRSGKRGDIGRHIVAWRQLNKDEGKEADGKQRWDHP